MKILDVMWFCGSSNVGIVRVESEFADIKYYIGSPPLDFTRMNTEAEDIQWIANWGSTFPKDVGDSLFGVK